jgi:hypothetical protein
MFWQCRYFDKDGRRCENEAHIRLHFNGDHPFDHTDLCTTHFKEYTSFVWTQDLTNFGVN